MATCFLCPKDANELPDDEDQVLHHLQLLHPAEYGQGLGLLPSGQPAVFDAHLRPVPSTLRRIQPADVPHPVRRPDLTLLATLGALLIGLLVGSRIAARRTGRRAPAHRCDRCGTRWPWTPLPPHAHDPW